MMKPVKENVFLNDQNPSSHFCHYPTICYLKSVGSFLNYHLFPYTKLFDKHVIFIKRLSPQTKGDSLFIKNHVLNFNSDKPILLEITNWLLAFAR